MKNRDRFFQEFTDLCAAYSKAVGKEKASAVATTRAG